MTAESRGSRHVPQPWRPHPGRPRRSPPGSGTSDVAAATRRRAEPHRPACEADAQQLLVDFAPGLPTTELPQVTIRAIARDGTRERPSQGAQPEQVAYQIEGALASFLAAREACLIQHSCFILATNAPENPQLPAQALRASDKGQNHANPESKRTMDGPRLCRASCVTHPWAMAYRDHPA
jgi:hypothetical protein